MDIGRQRYILPVVGAGAALAVGGALALGGASSAAARTVQAQRAVSQNWAGYVVRSNIGDQQFSSVSGSWTEPSAGSSSSTGAGQGYGAFWIGLGGSSGQSQALEQIGTSADTVDGQTEYYAWYELVPAPETRLNIAIHPGDRISASVKVSGTTVTMSLTDQTTGQSLTKQLQMSNPDTSSAEWIAEAPSAQGQDGSYQTLPLADFGTVTFNGAAATSGGHTGTIADPDWSVQQVQLAPAGGSAFVSSQTGSGAQPSSLAGDGSSFSVSWSPDTSPAAGGAPAAQTGGDDPYGYVPGGDGYGGYGGGSDGYGGYGI